MQPGWACTASIWEAFGGVQGVLPPAQTPSQDFEIVDKSASKRVPAAASKRGKFPPGEVRSERAIPLPLLL
jgi:hypothetical protein